MTTDPEPAATAVSTGHELADAVAAAVLAVPGVARLHAGAFGEVATYLPGRRVPGVRIGPGGVEVHVVVDQAVLDWQVPLPEVAEHVHRAVAALVPTGVHVYIDDLATEPSPMTSPPERPGRAGAIRIHLE
ncbi:hypothetical protein [Georgenia sp. SYP-B2076]|uniref:hypothetical protein n=1 Tax=Georgenia sp. SYP-B2076 TaxID=2495881 RepID=UPI00197AD4E5|nr:hypothetical protein [Georgenia sp. SYP-B2076]